MRDVIKKVRDQMPHRLFWLQVFLPAQVAIPAKKLRVAV